MPFSLSVLPLNGIRVLDWCSTEVGDKIHALIEVTGVRPTSTGGRAIVDSTIHVFNQRDEEVMTYTARRMLAGQNT